MLQARQRAELSATDADSKLKALMWANDHSSSSDKKRSQALADVDASLMQRLEQDSSDTQRLSAALKSAQVAFKDTSHLSMCIRLAVPVSGGANSRVVLIDRHLTIVQARLPSDDSVLATARSCIHLPWPLSNSHS